MKSGSSKDSKSSKAQPPKNRPQQEQANPADRQQQGSSGTSGAGGQYGEGNYEATRQYNEGLKKHMQEHDIEKEARDAEPRSASEEKEMEEAERKGKRPSRGEGSSGT